jgi:predicted RNA binding protein YcfA (HicA-like mRNA interferase family)
VSKFHKSLEVFLRHPTPREATRAEVEQALTHLHFQLQSHKGSHYRWRHADGARITYALIGGRKAGVTTVEDIATEIRRRRLGE